MSNAIRLLLKWAIFIGIIGTLIAPAEIVSTPTKLLTAFCGLILIVVWLKGALVRYIKSENKAPAWDEIKSVPPIIPEPPLKEAGVIARALRDRFAKWTLNRKKKDDGIYLNAMGEMFDIGTKYTPRNPVEAMRWYRAAVGGSDPAKAHGPQFSKLRIAEMYEDGEGVGRDLDEAGRIGAQSAIFPAGTFGARQAIQKIRPGPQVCFAFCRRSCRNRDSSRPSIRVGRRSSMAFNPCFSQARTVFLCTPNRRAVSSTE